MWFRCYSGSSAGWTAGAILKVRSHRHVRSQGPARTAAGPAGAAPRPGPVPLAAAAQGPALTAARPGAGAEPAAGRGRAAAEAGSRTLTPGSRSRTAAKETRRTGHRARQVRERPPAAERRPPQRARPGGGSTGSGGGRAVTVRARAAPGRHRCGTCSRARPPRPGARPGPGRPRAPRPFTYRNRLRVPPPRIRAAPPAASRGSRAEEPGGRRRRAMGDVPSCWAPAPRSHFVRRGRARRWLREPAGRGDARAASRGGGEGWGRRASALRYSLASTPFPLPSPAPQHSRGVTLNFPEAPRQSACRQHHPAGSPLCCIPGGSLRLFGLG